MTALEELRKKVASGHADMFDFAAVWPSATAYGPEKWQDAHKAYHGSINGALALHEAVLPGWGWNCDSNHGASVWVVTNRDGTWVVEKERSETDNHSPARAWLLAILDALMAQERQ